jgi:hypothetical protein
MLEYSRNHHVRKDELAANTCFILDFLRQEVEGVPELDWLRMLLADGCPLDAFAHLVEYEESEKLLKFVERRHANEDEFRLGTFQFDATAAWVVNLLRKWDLAQLTNDVD